MLVLHLGLAPLHAQWTVYDPAVQSQLAINSATEVAKFVQLINNQVSQIRTLTGPLEEEDRRIVAARAILGEWLGGSGGGWQDSGGVWPGIKLIAAQLDGMDAEGLRMAMDKLRDKLGSGVIVLGTHDGEKVSLCVGVTKDLTARIKAGDLIKKIAPLVGGSGGGRPDMAQAGGKDVAKLTEAIAQVSGIVGGMLN